MAMKPKRCSECGKILNIGNKSGYCGYHNMLRIKREKRLTHCYICKEPCSGNMLIETRKSKISSFCTYHFNQLVNCKNQTELRKKIKYLKSYH